MKYVKYIILTGVVFSIGVIFIKKWLLTAYISPSLTIQKPQPTSLQQLLGSDYTNGFQQAIKQINFNFPHDHGPHPRFRSEWWYLTGHLFDNNQQHYGFQFTLFRFASRANTTSTNPWLEPQFYMAHVALSNSHQQAHRSAEKLSRQGPGLASVQLNPFHGWLENWQFHANTSETLFPAQLTVQVPEQNIGLQLTLSATKPLVLQGNQGLSQKSPRPGNASYYYSYPRLAVTGSINWDQQQTPITGQAWFDHEWGTSALDDYQVGWDWFSLQLDNQQELMIYRVRSQPGHPETLFAMLNPINQPSVKLTAQQIEIKTLKHWRAKNGTTWPAKWQINIPKYHLSLTLTPTQPNQLMKHLVTYWEGAVKVSGSHQGWGFVELTGY